ncbi:MAG: Holliday junction resolvase RuvX [Spirochaetes bacterium]|nr:Holliday junction resolvase RuvX [Spirochaetota bacterium]
MGITKNENGKFLGIDVGTKRTGVSISNTAKTIAFPHKVIPFKGKEELLQEIEKIISEENIIRIIIGNPLNTRGERSSLTKNTFEIIDYLKKSIELETVMQDEKYSTQKAHTDLYSMKMNWKKRKQVVDKVAAAIILQNYLESYNKE